MKRILPAALGLCLYAALLTGCRKGAESWVLSGTLETAYPENTDEEAPGPGAEPAVMESEVRETESFIYVHVCGEVVNPGVYELPKGARAWEAISMAGGLTADAAAEAVNQALALADGQQLLIPSLAEQEAARGTAETQSALVNINLADASRLMTLPGIGEAKAADIIAYREAHGPFTAIEEIKNVSGIKDALFNRIKDKIVV